jgi:hypothetical protein
MSWSTIVSSPLFWGVVVVVAGAACSATAAATRLTHPRLSAWLSAFAAALPADVTRMSPGAAPRKVEPPVVEPPPAVAAELLDTVKERHPGGP